jgi:hypothetical protein
MLIGFVFWYRGPIKGGVAAVGQLQLLQPFLSLLCWWRDGRLNRAGGDARVVACVAGARRRAR